VVRRRRQAKLLGIGLDNDDGHVRITHGRDFHVVGGSKETHASMQDKCVRFGRKLDERGKRLGDLKREELLDLAGECEMDVVLPPDRPD
jgi:hypothetical protein